MIHASKSLVAAAIALMFIASARGDDEKKPAADDSKAKSSDTKEATEPSEAKKPATKYERAHEREVKAAERSVHNRDGYFVVSTTETAPVGHSGYTRNFSIEEGKDQVVEKLASFMAADHPKTTRKYEIHDVFPLTEDGKKQAEKSKKDLEAAEAKHRAQMAAKQRNTMPGRRR
jgi:hypothetical protein